MSTIYQDVRAGRPVRALFIDVHGHFGPWPETTIPYALDHARVIAEMDRFGCDQVWMSASNPGYSADLRVKNDYVFDLAEAHPDRIIPYCTLSANTQSRNVTELNRCLARGRCIGVKMHHYGQPPYTCKSAFLQPILEILAGHHLVYINHSFEDLAALRWALEKYPDLTFMSGHFWPGARALMDYPNYVDCTCAANEFKSVEQEIARTGTSERLLVGSDFSLFTLSFGIGMIAYADMEEHHKRNILGINALHLLRRVAWFKDLKFRKRLAL